MVKIICVVSAGRVPAGWWQRCHWDSSRLLLAASQPGRLLLCVGLRHVREMPHLSMKVSLEVVGEAQGCFPVELGKLQPGCTRLLCVCMVWFGEGHHRHWDRV